MKSKTTKKSAKVVEAIAKAATADKPRKVIKPRARLTGTLSPAIRAILERTRVGRAELDGIIESKLRERRVGDHLLGLPPHRRS